PSSFDHHLSVLSPCLYLIVSINTATTEIYTLSLHDALPIWEDNAGRRRELLRTLVREALGVADTDPDMFGAITHRVVWRGSRREDRKSTRLNSSHVKISYAVFCLKKKKKSTSTTRS